MGIYIKGIKKPWRCDECMFTDNFDECIFLKTDADIDGLNIDCPIVEIADREIENSSEKPNNCDTCKHALGDWDGESNNCGKCCGADHKFYEPKDEPQTDDKCKGCIYLHCGMECGDSEDEPQNHSGEATEMVKDEPQTEGSK